MYIFLSFWGVLISSKRVKSLRRVAEEKDPWARGCGTENAQWTGLGLRTVPCMLFMGGSSLPRAVVLQGV